LELKTESAELSRENVCADPTAAAQEAEWFTNTNDNKILTSDRLHRLPPLARTARAVGALLTNGSHDEPLWRGLARSILGNQQSQEET
jgi:hypothetical protein